MAADQKTYRPKFFRDWFFNPILWVIFVFIVPIIVIVSIGSTANEKDLSFWNVFWTPSQELYPNPIIGAFPTGIEMLIVALAIWFLIVFFLWVTVAFFDKVVLTDELIKYWRRRVKLSDIERIAIGEAGPSVITKIYPAVPRPAELPQAVLKGKGKFDLPRWLINTEFFEDLKKRAPEIRISLPNPKPYIRSLAIIYFLVFFGILLGIGGWIYWLKWVLSLPFTHFGSFNFVEFLKTYPLIDKGVTGVGGLISFIIFIFLGMTLFLIYDKEWRKIFLKLSVFLGFLHFLGWLLYYFGILK